MTGRYDDVKKLASPMVPNLLIIGVILILLRVFKPSHVFIMLVIVLPVIAISMLRSMGWKKFIIVGGKALFITSLYLIGFWYALLLLGGWGWMGLVIMVVGISTWRLVKNKKEYFGAMRGIEKKIWGKPLDKELWKDEKKN